MGRHHLTPGPQPQAGLAFDGGNGSLARLVAHLFLEAHAQQFLLLPLDLARLPAAETAVSRRWMLSRAR